MQRPYAHFLDPPPAAAAHACPLPMPPPCPCPPMPAPCPRPIVIPLTGLAAVVQLLPNLKLQWRPTTMKELTPDAFELFCVSTPALGEPPVTLWSVRRAVLPRGLCVPHARYCPGGSTPSLRS